MGGPKIYSHLIKKQLHLVSKNVVIPQIVFLLHKLTFILPNNRKYDF